MSVDSIQAVASLVAGLTGLTALTLSFALERARRKDDERDRLLDRRLAACHDFMTVAETRVRRLVPAAALVRERTKAYEGLVRDRTRQPHDERLLRRVNDASHAWYQARDAFVAAAVAELGTDRDAERRRK
jgi:hypothetical protein